MDTYVLGIWDDRTGEWLDEYSYQYYDPTITLDGSSIYIYNRIQVGQLLSLLKYASRNQNARFAFNAGMYALEDEDEPGFWGEYDVSGLEDALTYLDCFAGVR